MNIITSIIAGALSIAVLLLLGVIQWVPKDRAVNVEDSSINASYRIVCTKGIHVSETPGAVAAQCL